MNDPDDAIVFSGSFPGLGSETKQKHEPQTGDMEVERR